MEQYREADGLEGRFRREVCRELRKDERQDVEQLDGVLRRDRVLSATSSGFY